jgi:hypothetical protein
MLLRGPDPSSPSWWTLSGRGWAFAVGISLRRLGGRLKRCTDEHERRAHERNPVLPLGAGPLPRRCARVCTSLVGELRGGMHLPRLQVTSHSSSAHHGASIPGSSTAAVGSPAGTRGSMRTSGRPVVRTPGAAGTYPADQRRRPALSRPARQGRA